MVDELRSANCIATDESRGFELHKDIDLNGDYRLRLVLLERAIDQAREQNPSFKKPTAAVIISEYNAKKQILETYPVYLNFGKHFLKPKYDKIRKITLEGRFPLQDPYPAVDGFYYQSFPAGLVKTPLAGLGLNYELRYIVREIERLGPYIELKLVKTGDVVSVGDSLLVPYKIFDTYRRKINRAHEGAIAFANKAKAEYLETSLRLALDPNLNLPETGKGDRALAELLVGKLTGAKKNQAIVTSEAFETVRQSMKATAEADPIELMNLHREIELVTLEKLIERMAVKIKQTTLGEPHWQEFLTANAFVLQLAFNLPALVFKEQVSVGGTRFDGSGGKLADYLLRIGGIGNLAIVEIKKPGTKLVESRQYREGLHAPTNDLSGAVSQVLDQKYKLEQEINNKKVASRVYDVFTYSVPCLVIAGVLPTRDDEQKSLELFRNNLRNVAVITFDELLQKLQVLHNFLSQPSEAENLHVVCSLKT